jgi:hypothetical protein
MRTFAIFVTALSATPHAAHAQRDLDANPSNFESMLDGLMPGDTLRLAAGDYDFFSLSGIAGTAEMPIVITGPEDGGATIHADSGPCCNTIEIRSDVSYVVLRNLTVDGGGVDGAFGVSASGSNVHHITIEGCTFLNHDSGQQNVAISTKTPTAGWIIRGNRIMGAGTGMYLGNSDGNDPFIDGLIENNLFFDTIGYNVQIKWQLPHDPVPGAPAGPSTTIIRHNVFIKTDRPSDDGDRPNLLVGGFPESGADSENYYEIYGNLFVHNPREAHLQVSGRASIHDNVFVDVAGTAIVATNHDLPLRRVWIYNNTIFGAGTGISVANAPEGSAVIGNLIFAGNAISGSPTIEAENVTDTAANAGMYVTMPSTTLGAMDFYPVAGRATGAALDLSMFMGDTEYDRDFNCRPKDGFTFRGAYAGEGSNPGWRLAMENKPAGSGCSMGPPPGRDGGVVPGTDGGSNPRRDGGIVPGTDGGASSSEEDSGCGCSTGGLGSAAPLLFVALLCIGRSNRRTRRP